MAEECRRVLADMRSSVAEQRRAGRSIYDIPEPHEPIPGRLEPVFGCQPWTPGRERAKRVVAVTAPDGLPAEVEVCDVCGSGMHELTGQTDRLTRETYCAACGRSHRDGEIAAKLARGA